MEELTMNMNKKLMYLKASFIIGAIADFIVAVNWLLISMGYRYPNLICSFNGTGDDYRFAMYIATMFMLSWTAILFWGYFKPYERKGLLLITSVLLLLSILIECIFYWDILAGAGFMWGVILRLLLITKFTFSYLYSMKK